MGGENISLQFETGAISSSGGNAIVRLTNTGDNVEHTTIYLMPGFVPITDIDLPSQSIQEFQFNLLGGDSKAPTLSWVRIQVSTDQVVPTAIFTDANVGKIEYLPGDFAAFNLLTGTGTKARLW